MVTVSSRSRRTPEVAVAGTYLPPTLLADVHLLDVLELSGSQQAAACFLDLHQSTVSRSLRSLQLQLQLQSGLRSAACRLGRNHCLDLLRLAARAHRNMSGVLRLSTDNLHQSLLQERAALQPVPSRFRRLDDWADLIRLGLLDGAITSSEGLEKHPSPGEEPRWNRLRLVPLGHLSLQLMACTPHVQGVLLPSRAITPLLHQRLERQGYRIVIQPMAAHEPDAWLKRLRDRQLAVPLCPALQGAAWLREQGLLLLPQQPAWQEKLWLLLPAPSSNPEHLDPSPSGLDAATPAHRSEPQTAQPRRAELQPARPPALTALERDVVRHLRRRLQRATRQDAQWQENQASCSWSTTK